MQIVTRAGWHARAPRARTTVPWSARTEFFVHHTDGPESQPIRSIQDFHMGPQRGWSDVGYNFLVDDDGVVYEGRGWLVVGAHCPNHNRTGIGVAYIGKNAPTDAAKQSIRWLYDEACRRAGRQLRKLCHGDRYPTECPGPALRAWVHAGMPATGTPSKPDTTTWTEKLVRDLPLLRPGAKGYDVKTLRAALFARGGLAEDRYGGAASLKCWLEKVDYDDELVEDVEDFQRDEGLDDDGLVGRDTWTALLRVAQKK
ncbi:N-acetylmuramoyl-L-alanine amidase [Nonomuraea pusilla]|uniref:N-acetylmuramoyl-L-alanine amidase n=1 Tax=Nonomuraea pusilla TaxID=46177 RepID=UPI003328EDA9